MCDFISFLNNSVYSGFVLYFAVPTPSTEHTGMTGIQNIFYFCSWVNQEGSINWQLTDLPSELVELMCIQFYMIPFTIVTMTININFIILYSIIIQGAAHRVFYIMFGLNGLVLWFNDANLQYHFRFPSRSYNSWARIKKIKWSGARLRKETSSNGRRERSFWEGMKNKFLDI